MRSRQAVQARYARLLARQLRAGATVAEARRCWPGGESVIRVKQTRGVVRAWASYGPVWSGETLEQVADRLANRRLAGWTQLRVYP
jgi:tRNA(Ile2) C34 agmatinyltransferase TiaS